MGGARLRGVLHPGGSMLHPRHSRHAWRARRTVLHAGHALHRLRHARAARERRRRETGEESHGRTTHVLHAHHRAHRLPFVDRHEERRVVAIAARRFQDRGALPRTGYHGVVGQDVRHDIMHRMQVVEDDGRFLVSRSEGGRDGRRHRHDARHVFGSIIEHLPEARDGCQHAGLSLLLVPSHHQRLVEPDLQPVIAPDQAVELGVALAKRERVWLALHQVHVLGQRAEGEVPACLVVRYQLGDLGVLVGLRHLLGGEHIVDLAVQQVRPVEHLLRFRRELGVVDLDRRFLEWKLRRTDEQLLRDEVVLVGLQLTDGRARVVVQSFVQDGVPVIEGVEQAIGGGVFAPEGEVELSWQVKLLVGAGPLCRRDARRDDRSGGAEQQCARETDPHGVLHMDA